MVPRNGDRPTLFFKAFDSPDVQSDLLADGREPHQSLMRFGLWIMFGIAISPEAIAIHSSTIECEGRAVLFLGESGTGKAPIPGCGRSTFPEHGCSTTTARLSECTRGRRPLSDRPGAARPLLPQHFAADCRNRPVEPGPGQRNHPTVNLAGRRIAAPVLPPAFAYDSDLQDRICRTLSDILTQAPVWHLACLPDKAAAELSYATVLGGKQRA